MHSGIAETCNGAKMAKTKLLFAYRIANDAFKVGAQ